MKIPEAIGKLTLGQRNSISVEGYMISGQTGDPVALERIHITF